MVPEEFKSEEKPAAVQCHDVRFTHLILFLQVSVYSETCNYSSFLGLGEQSNESI